MIKTRNGIAIGIVIWAAVGCVVGPDYRRPPALGTNALPDHFESAGITWHPSEPFADRPRGAWWEVFLDPILTDLEVDAASGNQTLQVASARLAAAQAESDITRSDFFPHLSATPSAYRQRSSQNLPENGHPAGSAYTFNNITIPLQVGWEPDLWGRIRRGLEASKARYQASSDDLESVRLSVQAEIAVDYFTLRSLDGEYALLKATVVSFQKAYDLVVRRRQGGIATDLDVAQALTQLRATEAQVPAVGLQQARLRHALATLVGRPATGFQWNPASPFSFAFPSIGTGLPGELLERRPDIAAAERRVAAANADIGVARTAFYPRFRINGLAGLQSVRADTVFDAPSRFWSVGPSVDWPLFTGGRNRAGVAVAEANYTATVAQYRASVLAAFQEVEDQLSAQEMLAAESDSEGAARDAARRTEEIATHRYQAGLVTYLEVATAQSVALGHERNLVRLQGERAVAWVALVKALGGGWEGPPLESSDSR